MFEALKDYLIGPEATLVIDQSGNPTSKDLQIACVIIFLEMAGADKDYALEEVQSIFDSAAKQFGISDIEVLELLKTADTLRADRKKVNEFISAITEYFSVKQRKLVFSIIWQVIFADSVLRETEITYARKLQQLLNLNEAQALAAKNEASIRL